jgi:hypothetical protein
LLLLLASWDELKEDKQTNALNSPIKNCGRTLQHLKELINTQLMNVDKAALKHKFAAILVTTPYRLVGGYKSVKGRYCAVCVGC